MSENISQHCKHPGFPLVPASAYGGSLFTYAERPAKLMQVLLTCEDMLSLALKKGWNAPCQRDRAVPVTKLHVSVYENADFTLL